MKNMFRKTAAVLAATLVVGGGQSFAAGVGTESHSRSAGASMSDASSRMDPTPEFGTFEYEQALETGTLPSGDGRAIDPPAAGKSGDQASVIDVGGFKYRVGIDTP